MIVAHAGPSPEQTVLTETEREPLPARNINIHYSCRQGMHNCSHTYDVTSNLLTAYFTLLMKGEAAGDRFCPCVRGWSEVAFGRRDNVSRRFEVEAATRVA
jgi:hypothetical protein